MASPEVFHHSVQLKIEYDMVDPKLELDIIPVGIHLRQSNVSSATERTEST